MTEHDELIVDTADLDAVTAALKNLGAWGGDWEVSEDLGLALLRNLKVGTGAELDTLITDLNAKLLSAGGAPPLLGKNDSAVIGYPQHKGILDPLDTEVEVVVGPPSGGAGIHVGVVDTPLFRHSTFGGEVVADEEIVIGETDIVDVWAGHATFVVGKIREHAAGARITVKAGLDGTSGARSLWETARKIASFRHTDIKILNLSLGVVTENDVEPLALRRALDRLGDDVVVVAAAGNRRLTSNPLKIFPAAFDDVIAVGALDAPFSMDRPWVDLEAPGIVQQGAYVVGEVDLLEFAHTSFTGKATWSGTSFAAATVTGALAQAMGEGLSGAAALAAVTEGPGAVAKKVAYPR
ncbi:Subtilase family protein [Amycolatopsis xylanica]|uniref:Subtilase family protein n=1 Tax=Amycolatopsis xylanica TaxID=589385 RepID=A0A1H3G2W7_9PSEU|nr:S8/S53 family peptidase [Amycolatopsis xylanica]SDX97038.1 Subtilase family protein [Amycolatopsis xylanica]